MGPHHLCSASLDRAQRSSGAATVATPTATGAGGHHESLLPTPVPPAAERGGVWVGHGVRRDLGDPVRLGPTVVLL